MNETMTDFGARAEDGVVNVYSNDMTDEFPVLKAFQQYIDAEQAKARKRMVLLCVFFIFVLTAVVSVFVVLLVNADVRNQSLNDRLVDYAMKDRDRQPVLKEEQQSPANAAVQALTDKLNSIQKALDESRERSRKAEEKAAAESSLKAESEKKAAMQTAEALEIERLKALLAIERERAATEREKKKQAELEEYRRKHYPELYEKKAADTGTNDRRRQKEDEEKAVDREIEEILSDVEPIRYFNDDDDEDDEPVRPRRKSTKKPAAKQSEEKTIPDDIKDAAGNTWKIPVD